MKTRCRGSLLTILFALAAALPAFAQSDEQDCRTWFPDFDSECDRQARPEGFAAPMSMPFLFEDPHITTGAQFAVVYHEYPGSSVFRGGYQTTIALQARVAITDDLAFIATKDGYTIFRPDVEEKDTILTTPNPNRALLDNEEGFYDITAGFKYAALRSEEDSFIFTPALRIEIPVGQQRVFQGQGDGVFIPSFSTAWGFDRFDLEELHFIGSFGAQVPFDGDKNSSSLFYNFHLDYAVHEHFIPFVEISGMRWVDGGDGSQKIDTSLGTVDVNTAQLVLNTGSFEGVDVANLGSKSVGRQDYATWGLGFRIPFNQNANMGFLYERPLVSKNKQLTKQRVTFMLAYDF